jgi:hypothetical protein
MTSPFILTKIYQGLTSKNQLLKRKLKLGTDEIPIPPKRDDVTTIEAINRFNKANPRVDTTNLKPLSVKHSNVKQSNVNEPDEGVIQGAFDTATREAQSEGFPAPNYEKFKARYLKRNMKAEGGRAGYEDGGMLVQPSDDGSRPGYAIDKRNNNYRVSGQRGGTTYAEWAKENNLPQTFSNKKKAKSAETKFYKSVTTKFDETAKNWSNEMTTLTERFNKIVEKDFEKGNMSKTPKFATWLNNQKLKYAGAGFFKGQAPNFGVINVTDKKFELADKLIEQASKTLKYTEWMDIQKKISPNKDIDTRTWRDYIDKNTKVNGQAAKVNQAFDYLFNNDIEIIAPKKSKVEGSPLRKMIADLTGAGKDNIVKGLNDNKNYLNNVDKINFSNQGKLWTNSEATSLKEILADADYRMKGNISWTSDIKLSNRANKNVFEYALRNYNYHQKYKTGEGTIQFYDKKTKLPIDWDKLKKNKNGFRTLKPNSVYFVDKSMPNKEWNMASIDQDNKKWKNKTGSSGLFDEVFQSKDVYDKLLSREVIDPNTGKKTNFGKLMKDVYKIGFNNFGNPYAIDHKDGVANNPFKNLRIASQRINSALSALTRDTKLNKFTKDGLFKILSEGTFDPNQKNVIDTIIQGTAPTRENVLVQGTKFDQSELDMAKQKFLTNLDKNKFRRVSTVLINAAKEGGFGEAVQKICMRKQAKKGGRMFLSNGSGCPAADQDPKRFLKSVSDNPQLAKFFKSGTGQKLAGAAARVTGNVLNPTTLIGGEVAFVLGDGLNNFASGLPLDESFDRAFVFGDFGKFEKNLMNKAKELGYDQNQLNLLQETMNINKLDNREKKLKYGLDNETPGSEDLIMGFPERLADTKNQLDNSVQNYISTLDKMGFDLSKDSSYDVGFRYLDNAFKKRTQDQLVEDFKDRERQVDPTKTPFGNFISPAFDLSSYTQPLKYGLDIINPFTKDVPFLSEQQQEAKKLRDMSQEDLDIYNKNRKFTSEDIQSGESPYTRQLMDYLGTDVTGQGFGSQFLASGGIASLTKTIPPESGPTPHGLPYVYNNVKKI